MAYRLMKPRVVPTGHKVLHTMRPLLTAAHPTAPTDKSATAVAARVPVITLTAAVSHGESEVAPEWVSGATHKRQNLTHTA